MLATNILTKSKFSPPVIVPYVQILLHSILYKENNGICMRWIWPNSRRTHQRKIGPGPATPRFTNSACPTRLNLPNVYSFIFIKFFEFEKNSIGPVTQLKPIKNLFVWVQIRLTIILTKFKLVPNKTSLLWSESRLSSLFLILYFHFINIYCVYNDNIINIYIMCIIKMKYGQNIILQQIF